MRKNFMISRVFSAITLFVAVVTPVILSESLVTRTSSVSTNDTDTLVWGYLLDKYSTDGSHLSSQDVTKVIHSLRKCSPKNETTSEDALGNSDKTSSFLSNPTCKGISIMQPNQQFDNLSSLNDICHKILFFLDNPSCCDSPLVYKEQPYQSSSLTGTDHSSNTKKLSKEKPTPSEVWGYGILCVTMISLCSLAGVSVMPFMKKNFYKHLLTGLVGLAVGSLTGSAVFHLIPQAFELSNNDPSHEYLNISLVVCGGIWLFFMVERILKFIMDYKDRKDNHWKREKISSIVSSTPENSTISMLVENGNANGIKTAPHEGRNGTSICSPQEPGVIYECQEQAIKASFGHQERPRLSSFHDHSVKFEQGKDSVIATVAYMIIFGDGLHNFIDGLSIGAAFNESILTGVSISVAVMCEELPHELGDFAVLLNAGMSIRQALTYNFLSACTCYIGMGVGIFLGEVEATTYIFALAGGMFLYIALVDMVPEMNEIAEETSKISVKKGLLVLLLQNLGLFAGITALFLLAKYQESIQF